MILPLFLSHGPFEIWYKIYILSLESAHTQFCTPFQDVKGTPEDNLCSLCESLSCKDSGATVVLWSWRTWAEVKQRLEGERLGSMCLAHGTAAKRKTRYQNFIYKIHNYRQQRWGRLHKIFEEEMIEEFNVSFESYCLSRCKKMFIVKWIFTETGCKQHKCPTIR